MGNAGRMRPVCGCIFRLTMGCERVRSSQSDIGYPRFGRLYRSEPERRVGHLGIEHQPVLDLGRGRGAVHALYQHRQRDFAGGDHTALQGRWHYRRSDRDGQQQHDGFCDRHRRCGVVHFRHVGRHHIRLEPHRERDRSADNGRQLGIRGGLYGSRDWCKRFQYLPLRRESSQRDYRRL